MHRRLIPREYEMFWRDEVLNQLDVYWEHNLMPRLADLTDEEYFWEPVPDCWSIRVDQDGEAKIDWENPVPEPPPVTTIAWRLTHIAVQVIGVRTSTHFGDGSFSLETAALPTSAKDALDELRRQYRDWHKGVTSLDDEALRRPLGQSEGPWAERAMATLLLHINREIMHHGAEIAVLRDLYRARFR